MKTKIIALFSILMAFNAFGAYRSSLVESLSYSNSIEQAKNSVVSVYSIKSLVKPEDNLALLQQDEFLKSINPDLNIKTQKQIGSGVIVSKNGLVMTNSHIVSDSSLIKIISSDNTTYDAIIIALDKSLDLAILKIQASPDVQFTPVVFADSDSVKVGDLIFALGNPFGLGQSASMGMVSAIGRSNFNLENAQYLIQTDAAINPGNSGGALINVEGQLVGIPSAIFSKTGSFSGVSFAVPSNAVRFVLDSMQNNGEVQRSWLGARGQNLTAHLVKRLALSSTNGVYLTNIVKNSPAYKAGLQAGDVLVRLHNFNIDNNKTLQAISSTLPVDKKVRVKVIRNSRVLDLEVKPQAMKKRTESDKFIVRGNNVFSGLVVEKLSPELNYLLNSPLERKGIAIIDRPRKISNLNLLVGDIIVKVNKFTINTLEDLKTALTQTASFGWNIELIRNGKNIKIFVK